VALVNQWLGLRTFLAHCLLHILHNGVKTALTKGSGKDPTKQRQGGNSPVIFLLEQVSKNVRDNWDELKLMEEGVSKPPEGCQTRWWSYGRVAIWLLQHHNSAYSAIDKEIAGTREPSQAWVKLLKGLTDETLLTQVHILAEFGLAFCEHEFLFIESGDSRHALVIHERLEQAFCLLATIIGLPEKPTSPKPSSLQPATLSNESVLELINSFTKTFADYFHVRTAFWFEPPFLFASLHNPSTRKDTAKKILRAFAEKRGKPEFKSEHWDALGLLTSEELLADLRVLAETGELPERLRLWVVGHFGRLPVGNAFMESVFQHIKVSLIVKQIAAKPFMCSNVFDDGLRR
jgi:hypothetical protein